MDLAIIIAIALLIFTAFIIVGTIKEYKEKDAEIERVSTDMKNNSNDKMFNIESEEQNLKEFLDRTTNKDELKKAFIAIKQHIEERVDDAIKKGEPNVSDSYSSLLEECRKKAARLFDLFSLQEKYSILLEKQAASADDFKQEETVLLNYINQACNLNELDNYFDEVKRFIKAKLVKSSSFKNKEISEQYIKKYRELFSLLKSSYENKLNNITSPQKSFYYDGIDEDIDANDIQIINAVADDDSQKLTAGKVALGFFIAFILAVIAESIGLISSGFARVLWSFLIVSGILLGVIWWLKKDYRRFKEQSRLWIFYIEVVGVCILLPAFLKPLLWDLWVSLYIWLR